MATTFTDFKDVKDTETPKSSEESKDFKEEGGTGNTTPGTESKSPQGGRVGSDRDALFMEFIQSMQQQMATFMQRFTGGGQPVVAAAVEQSTAVVTDTVADLINSRNSSRNMEISHDNNGGSDAGMGQPVKITLRTNIDFKVDVWEIRRIEWISSPWHNKNMLFPKDQINVNPINLFIGDNLSSSELEYCKKLSIVPSRQVFDQFRTEELNLKLDDKCRNSTPEFLQTDKVNVTDYLDRFWLNIKRYRLQDHQLAKEILFEHISVDIRNLTGHSLKPGLQENVSLPLKNFMCRLKNVLEPSNSNQIAKHVFKVTKQARSESIDSYFMSKKKLFDLAYGFKPTDNDIGEFYTNFISGLQSPALAKDLLKLVASMRIQNRLLEVEYFRQSMMMFAQNQLMLYSAGHTEEKNIVGCESYSYSLVKGITKTNDFQKGGKYNPIVINQVDSALTYVPGKKKLVKDREGNSVSKMCINNEQFEYNSKESMDGYSSDESDLSEHEIGVLNAREVICWYCKVAGHVVSECNDKKTGKPPHKEGRWVKNRERRRARRFTKGKFTKKPVKENNINQVNEDQESPCTDTEEGNSNESVLDISSFYPLPELFL